MTTAPTALFGPFRALAASRRRGTLAGGSGSTTIDRDLDRIALDLQAVSQADPERLAKPVAALHAPLERPLDLDVRRRRASQPTLASANASHARAS